MKLLKFFIFAPAALLVLLTALPAHATSFESGIKNGLLKANAITTEHFQIEFSDIIMSQTDSDGDDISDIIETVAAAAEYSWDAIIDDMNYADPRDSLERLMIILDEKNQYLAVGSLGITSVLSNGDPYIAIDPWQADDYLKITVAHELHHAVQFGIDYTFAYTSQGINLAEASAVWVEDEVYDDIDDYVYYLPDFFDFVDYSIFASIVPSDTLFEYALGIWPKFLTEFYNDTDVVREIWANYLGTNADYEDELEVYNAVLEVIQDRNDELPEVFQEFTLWNLDTSQYEEGNFYPSVLTLWGEQGEYTLSDEIYSPTLYGTNYLYFENGDGDDDFYFHIVKGDGVSYFVTLVPYENEVADIAAAEYVFLEQGDEMQEEMHLSGVSGAEAVIAVLSPIDVDFTSGFATEYIFDEGYLYYYIGQFGASLANEIDINAEINEGSEKTGEEATQEDVRGSNTLILSLLNYDESSVIFNWNRLVDDDIDGYEIRYGMSSDDYNFKKEISKAYTTSVVISDLEEGETYYFQLIAVDSDGDKVGEKSNELTVTPTEWLFSDLSYLDEEYDAVATLVEEGIFAGYPDGSFRAGSDINRAELLKILIEGRGLNPNEAKYRNCFPDVGTDWYAKYVCYAKERGWIKGYPDGYYRPANTVNKVEALKIMFNVYEAGLDEGQQIYSLQYPDLDANAWYAPYVWQASVLGILGEAPGETFHPASSRNRGDAAQELYRYLVVEGLVKE